MFRQLKRRTAGRRNFEDNNNNNNNNNLDEPEISKYLNPSSLYNSRLSFYDLPPIQEITLEQFETWAIDRLKILIEIESCLARSKSLKEIESYIKPLLLKYLPLNPSPGLLSTTTTTIDSQSNNNYILERMKDHYSHFILRLVFCRNEELRKNFIKNETILFKIRYNLLQPKEQQEFIELNHHKLNWQYITSEEKIQLNQQLFNSSGNLIKNQFLLDGENLTNDQLKKFIMFKENFIKLPFEKISTNNLINNRSIYLFKGYGYLPSCLQLNLLSIEFNKILNDNLIKTFQTIPILEEDDRLLPLLNNLSKNFKNFQYEYEYDQNQINNNNNDNLNSDINAKLIITSKIINHYPLCAQNLQRNLIINSHLKYGGRQQLGLFLKGIGLNIDEAIKFWSYQFTKSNSLSLETFNKDYKYNIRHQYGLEGARINYKPWDCSIILSKPRPNYKNLEYHGCPYRDFNLDVLINNLNNMGITDQQDLNTIIDDVNKHDYTIACTRVFELTHEKQLKKIKEKNNNNNINSMMHINHPNLYFDRSRQLERSENKDKEVKVVSGGDGGVGGDGGDDDVSNE